MTELSPKRRLFARHYITEKCNGTAAALKAGYSERTAKHQASQMLADPAVKAEVERLQAAHAEASNITMAKLFEGLGLAFEVALAKENAGAMVQAIVATAKLAGKWIERSEDVTERDRLEAEKLVAAQLGEVKSAADLLADAAESYGLPRAAPPAQIIGAISQTPIATPAAYKLLRRAMLENAKTTEVTDAG